MFGAGVYRAITRRPVLGRRRNPPSERVRAQIARFLEEADTALRKGDWRAVHLAAASVLAIDADDQDAHAYLAAADVHLSTSESRRLAREDVPWTVLWLLLAAGFVGILVFSLQFPWPKLLAVTSIGLAIGGASLTAGGMIGFLFGIPRTLQGDHPLPPLAAGAGADRNQPTTEYRANTNLEQISDWLTKILVGVGLTQITHLPGALTSLSDFLSPGLGGVATSGPFAAGLLVNFFLCGFFLVYLWSRLALVRAFRSADEEILMRAQAADEKAEAALSTSRENAASIEEVQALLTEQSEADARLMSFLDAALSPSANTPGPDDAKLGEVFAKASPMAKLQAFLHAQEVRAWTWRTDKVKMERTIPVFRVVLESSVNIEKHRIHAQLGYALKDKVVPDWSTAEAELTRAIDLRGHGGDERRLYYEFNRAVCLINQDEDFRHHRPTSNEAMRDRILDDIGKVKADPRVRGLVTKGDPSLTEWMRLNDQRRDGR